MPVSWRMQDWEGNGYCDYEGYGFSGGADDKPKRRTYFTWASEVKQKAGLVEPLGCLVVLPELKKAYASGMSSTQTATSIKKGVPATAKKPRGRKPKASATKPAATKPRGRKKASATKVPYSVKELRQMAKEAGFSGYSKLTKDELVKLLTTGQKKKTKMD